MRVKFLEGGVNWSPPPLFNFLKLYLPASAMATCSDDEYEIDTEQHKCGGCDDKDCDGQKEEDQAFQNMVKLCKNR